MRMNDRIGPHARTAPDEQDRHPHSHRAPLWNATCPSCRLFSGRNSGLGRQASSVKAFTLIELVISVALMSIILTAGYVCLRAALASRAMVEARSERLQSVRVAMATIAADLRAACPLDKDYEFLGMNRMIGDTEADNLDFATHHYTPQRSGEADFCEISYLLEQDPESAQIILWRRRDTYPDEQPLSGGSREAILHGLRGIRFEYYDGLDWFDEWGSWDTTEPSVAQSSGPEAGGSLLAPNNLSGMPEAVRVTLYMNDDDSRSRTDGAGAFEESPRGPPAIFSTVVRLNLAPITAQRSYDAGAAGSAGSTSVQDANQGGSP